MMKKIYNHMFLGMILGLSVFGLTGCATNSRSDLQNSQQASISSRTIENNLPESSYWQGNAENIWNRLQYTSTPKLTAALGQTSNPNHAAWLKLAIISKQAGANTTDLVNHLIQWRANYPDHPGNRLFPSDDKLTQLLNTPTPKHIALLLPLEGPLGKQGQIIRDGFLNAYYESLAKNPKQTISFYDTSKGKDISSVYQEALSQGADMVIGPLSKENVQQLSRQGSYPVPTIALNYTDIGSGQLPDQFYQFGLSPKDEAKQLADKAWLANRSRAIIIAHSDEWTQRIIKPLLDQWASLGGKVVDTYYFTQRSNFSQDIPALLHVNPKEDRDQTQEDNDKQLLEQQRRQDFDVIFLLTQPEAGREIAPLLKYYYTDNIPIYSTSVIYSGVPSPQKDYDLNGIIFCDIPWILNKASKGNSNRLYAVGRDAQLLSNTLPRLILLPHFPLSAATGALTLRSTQQVYRQVPWTEMRSGRP